MFWWIASAEPLWNYSDSKRARKCRISIQIILACSVNQPRYSFILTITLIIAHVQTLEASIVCDWTCTYHVILKFCNQFHYSTVTRGATNKTTGVLHYDGKHKMSWYAFIYQSSIENDHLFIMTLLHIYLRVKTVIFITFIIY